MGWFFQILPALVVLFIISSIVRAARKVAKKMNETPQPRGSAANYDPAAAERTRRIQEEIRRKILERRGGVIPPQTVEREREEMPPTLPPTLPTPIAARATTPSTAAILERQQQLAEQMRALEAARASTQRKAEAITAESERIEAISTAPSVLREAVLADLRSPGAARRAIILREILGPPVGIPR